MDRTSCTPALESRREPPGAAHALSEDGNPTLATVPKVLKALGLGMRIEAAEAA